MSSIEYIVSKEIPNTNTVGKYDEMYKTQDDVFLLSAEEETDLKPAKFSDYAVLCGARLQKEGDLYSGWRYLRSAERDNFGKCFSASTSKKEFVGKVKEDKATSKLGYDVYAIDANNKISKVKGHLDCGGICPAMYVNSYYWEQSTALPPAHSTISADKRTMTLGAFPQTYVGEELNEELKRAARSGLLVCKNKRYTGYFAPPVFVASTAFNTADIVEMNKEYMYKGKRYVRVIARVYDDNSRLSDGTKPIIGGEYWCKVEPVVWNIESKEALRTYLDAHNWYWLMKIRTRDAILTGFPMGYNSDYYNKKVIECLWQNSMIRGMLNGYNLEKEICNKNGNPDAISHNVKSTHSTFTDYKFLDQLLLEEFAQQKQQVPTTYTRVAPQSSNGFTSSHKEKEELQEAIDDWSDFAKEASQPPQVQEQQKKGAEAMAKRIFKKRTQRNGMTQEEIDETYDVASATEIPIGKMHKKTRLDKMNPDQTPVKQRRLMTDTEKIKTWIESGQSVLLRGPSGIGKTERIKTLYPDLIYIKLTNNMFPERVVGSVNLQTGDVIPPSFAKDAILSCATEEEKKLVESNIQNLFKIADAVYERSKTSTQRCVILLDELLNVKPAVQSLVYTLVLNKIVETGSGLKLPANVVIVATGNQKKYSSVAEDLAEPLQKRFDHILDMRPKVEEWVEEYAIPNKVHPSVVSYICSKYFQHTSQSDYDINYFYEEPEISESHPDEYGTPGKTNDPRGWVSISQMLYNFEEDLSKDKYIGKNVEDLLYTSLITKLRPEWAHDFFQFYNNPTLTPQEIVERKYDSQDLPTDTNSKFATMAGLLSATASQIGPVRKFIKTYCDPEYLAVFDVYWAGSDIERMKIVDQLDTAESLSGKNSAQDKKLKFAQKLGK